MRNPLTAVLTLAAISMNAHAAIVAFDGGGDGTSYGDLSNWSGDSVPGIGDQITVGGTYQVTRTGNTAIVLQNETTAGSLTIGASAKLTLTATTTGSVLLSLQQAPAFVDIYGELVINGGGAIVSNSESSTTSQGQYNLYGTFRIGDWNNTIRSSGLANGQPLMDFNQLGATVYVSGIAAGGDQTNYLSKFNTASPLPNNQFWGINGTAVQFTNTSTGAISNSVGGLHLVRQDDFANGMSTVTLVPEPSACLLASLAALGLIRRRRRI